MPPAESPRSAGCTDPCTVANRPGHPGARGGIATRVIYRERYDFGRVLNWVRWMHSREDTMRPLVLAAVLGWFALAAGSTVARAEVDPHAEMAAALAAQAD